MKLHLLAILALLCLFKQNSHAECSGKADLGGVYLKVDIIEAKKTAKSISMGGVRGDATVLVYKGFCIKPSFITAWGKENSHLYTGSIGIGHYFPINKQICFLPTVGINMSEMTDRNKVQSVGSGLEDVKFKRKFRSYSPYIGIDVTWSFCDSFMITGVAQYAWARTHSSVADFYSAKGHSSGPNFGILLDYYLNKCWSINAGFGYNSSLSDEKHGMRVKGGKIGVAYWF